VPSYDVNGKVALVTGAARGIGFETARALLARGASVAVVDLDAATAEAAAARLEPSRAIGIGADVSDRGAMQQAVATTVERLGRVDVVVANAGISPTYATFRAMATEPFERTIAVNLMGVVRTVDAALPQVVENGGHVVVVASVYAFQNGVGMTPYAMAKAGVEQFGRALRLELQPHGASASVAYFGLIDTKLVHDAIDADPAVGKLFSAAPKAMLKRLPPSVAGDAIARGIERRAPRIIRPRIYVAIAALRGLLGPVIDRRFERDERVAEAVRDMDARSEQEQTTTA
jgi:NAD(P)-dependent dehydrogenase (short-subunit alcohol dehydrogenase family)